LHHRATYDALIIVKFGMEEHKGGLLLHANFSLIGEGMPINFKIQDE